MAGRREKNSVRNWYRYDNEDEVICRFNLGKVLSGVILTVGGDYGQIYVACAKKRQES